MKKKVLGITLATVLVLSLGLVLAAPVAADPGPGVAGLWHLDEGSGTTASDSSGNGNDGTLRMGTALDFDGNDFVSIPDPDGAGNLDDFSELTLEAWIYPDTVSEDVQIIISKYDTYTDWISYYLGLAYDEVRIFVGESPTKYAWYTTDSADLTSGSWYHVAGTWDGSTFKVFVNGVEEAGTTTVPVEATGGFPTAMQDGSVDVELGAIHSGADGNRDHYFDGKMSGVRISDVARTSFEACAPSVDGNTIGLWHLDEGMGQTADDAADNSDGQLGSTGGADADDPAWVDSGPTWTTGVCGDALSFDGDDFVCVPDASSLDITGDLTIEAWVKTSVTMDANAKMQIVDKGEHEYDSAYMLMIWEGYLIGRVNKDDNTRCTSSSPYPSDGEWHHVAYSFTDGSQRLCIDGTIVGTNTGSTTISANNQPLFIGNGVERSYYWDGLIDEVRIWDSATPIFGVDADPDTDVNPVGADHDVDVEVDIDGTAEPAMCVGVNLDVISGPNSGDSDSDSTDCNGEVTFTYIGDGGTGTDTIRIWVDQDCSGDFDDTKDAYEEVTKTWVTFAAVDGLTPPVAYNPVGGEHCVTALVDPAVAGAEVFFQVSGANTASGSRTTVAGGTATFCYDGNNPGTDTILAYLDVNDNQSFDDGTDISLEVTKYWLEHFVTGGGMIKEGKGKSAFSITFGGNVGYDLAGNEVGQWNINIHNVNDPAIDKGHFHSTEITDIGFFDIADCPEPDPPDADYNYAHFVATGRFNGEDGWELRFNMTDYGEGNKLEPDGIRVRLWNLTDPNPVFDSSESGEHYKGAFTNEGECALARRTRLDGGNIQIHPPEIP